MFLDYKNIVLDRDGILSCPLLRLQKLSGETLGILNGVHDLSFKIGFSELSEVSFTIPYMIDGVVNPLYKDVTGYKVLYTKDYGIYLLAAPSISGNGLSEEKTVRGYSLEKTFEKKDLFLAEGVYRLYSTLPDENSIMHQILELDASWEVAYADPVLETRYRTFGQYKGNALSFLYGEMMEKYRCLTVFNPYKNSRGKREIYLYDADKDITMLPIYLSYDNVLEETKVSELTDELITKLHVYGSDELSIVDVNPMGVDYLINLDHFINNGDIDPILAKKVQSWQNTIDANREYFSGLTALRASSTARMITIEASIVDLEGQLSVKKEEQNAIIQGMALNKDLDETEETTNWSNLLADKASEIKMKEEEISTAKHNLEVLKAEIASYAENISEVVKELRYKGENNEFFTEDDYSVLDQYMIESTAVEETFVYSEIDTTNVGNVSTFTGSVQITDSKISEIQMNEYQKTMWTFVGGTIVVPEINLSAKIIRGTAEKNQSNDIVCSLYLGSCMRDDKFFQSGMMTVSGVSKSFSTDTKQANDNGIITVEGSSLSFSSDGANFFFTSDVNEYQKYSVQKELYDFGVNILEEKAHLSYEFTIDSANFLFVEEFEPFKDCLEFGSAIHLLLGSAGRVDATFIGIDLNFDKQGSIGLVFSNRFQRHDGKTRLKQLLDKTYSSSRSFDASKYIYKQAANKTSQVEDYINASRDLATNTITNSKNQHVVIDNAGINIGGETPHQMRLMNSMLAVTDDGWQSSRLAIGEIDGKMQVNAEVLAGELVVGENLVIESVGVDDVTQFKVDGLGVQMHNATMTMTNNDGGKILIDPKYGILAGTQNLFTVTESGYTPSFIGAGGKIQNDSDGIPLNTNFYINGSNGEAYFRGKIVAGSGDIGGWKIGGKNANGTDWTGRLYSGSGSTYVGLNTSTANHAGFAIWAGGENPNNAKFYVKNDGTVKVKGAVTATDLLVEKNGKEESVLTNGQIEGEYLNLKGVTVTDSSGQTTFKVDSTTGVVTLGANTVLKWDAGDPEARQLAQEAKEAADDAKTKISAWTYSGSTYIDGSQIATGTVKASKLCGGTIELLGQYLYWNNGNIVAEETKVGEITLSSAQSSDFSVDIESLGSIRLKALAGNMFLSAKDGANVTMSDVFSFGADIVPWTHGGANCGYSNRAWSSVYSQTGSVTLSDLRAKHAIEDLPGKYMDMLDYLSAKRYILNDGESGRYHVGYIAQDVYEAMCLSGISSDEFAGIVIDTKNDIYMLRYEEFIPIIAQMIKRQKLEVQDLYARIECLEEKIKK